MRKVPRKNPDTASSPLIPSLHDSGPHFATVGAKSCKLDTSPSPSDFSAFIFSQDQSASKLNMGKESWISPPSPHLAPIHLSETHTFSLSPPPYASAPLPIPLYLSSYLHVSLFLCGFNEVPTAVGAPLNPAPFFLPTPPSDLSSIPLFSAAPLP